MAKYWPIRLLEAMQPNSTAMNTARNPSNPHTATLAQEDDYDYAHKEHHKANVNQGGWKSKLQHCLDDLADEVTKHTDTIWY